MKVLIAGHEGFLGQHLMRTIPGAIDHGEPIKVLWDWEVVATRAFTNQAPDAFINACGTVGGILSNTNQPEYYFKHNVDTGLNLLKVASLHVKKMVQIGTVCSYPENAPCPMREENFWDGRPDITVRGYGLAKRALVDYAQCLYRQDKFNVINPILANLYGPGDHYEGNRSHVVAAMIKRFCEAVDKGIKEVTFWGTGKCTREFLYVEDAADAIGFLLHNYDSPEIVNVSSGYEVTMAELSRLIAQACGYHGDIKWDTSKPDGQARRHYDTSKMEKLGWTAKTSLAEGILKTIESYRKQAVAA